jgi:hypothetical protein
MDLKVILLSLLLILPIAAQRTSQPVILPEPVPIEDETTVGQPSEPLPSSEPLQEPEPLQPSEPLQNEAQSVLGLWEKAFVDMQNSSVSGWLSICMRASIDTIPYVPHALLRAIRLIPQIGLLFIRLLKMLPEISKRTLGFVVSLPSTIRNLAEAFREMVNLLMVCAEILPQLLGSSKGSSTDSAGSMSQLLTVMGALSGMLG